MFHTSSFATVTRLHLSLTTRSTCKTMRFITIIYNIFISMVHRTIYARIHYRLECEAIPIQTIRHFVFLVCIKHKIDIRRETLRIAESFFFNINIIFRQKHKRCQRQRLYIKCLLTYICYFWKYYRGQIFTLYKRSPTN